VRGNNKVFKHKTFNIGKFMKVIITSIIIIIFSCFIIGSCANESLEKRKKWREEFPVEAAQKRCHSKSAGSRPACWTKADWQVYCQKVQCK